jgi:hypothetical protein
MQQQQLRFSNGDVFPRPRNEATDVHSRKTLHTFPEASAEVFNVPSRVSTDSAAQPMSILGRRGDVYVTAENRSHPIFVDASSTPNMSSIEDAGAIIRINGEFFADYGISVWNGLRAGAESVAVSSRTTMPQSQNLGRSTFPAIEQADFYFYNFALGDTYIRTVDRLARPLSLLEAYLQPCPTGTAEDAQGNCTVTSVGARSPETNYFGPKVLLRNDYALGKSNEDGSWLKYECPGIGKSAVVKSTNSDGSLDVACVQCSDFSTPNAQGTCANSMTSATKITPRFTSMYACPQGTAEDVYLNCTVTESGEALGLPLQGEWSASSGLWQCSDPGTFAYLRQNTTPSSVTSPFCMYCPNFERPVGVEASEAMQLVNQPQCPAYASVYYPPCPAGTIRGERGMCLRLLNCPLGSQVLASNPTFCMVTQDSQFLQGNAPRITRAFAPPNSLLTARSAFQQGSHIPPWREHIVGGTNAVSRPEL